MDGFRAFSRDGVGIHTGEHCSIRVSPGEAGSGVLFVTARGDVPLCPESIAGDSRRATDLALGGARVRTVEHLAAALVWFGARDARIEVDGPEIPILDGSAAPWVDALAGAGAIPSPAFVRIREPVRASIGESKGEIQPLDEGCAPVYEVSIDFDGADVGPGRASFRPLDDDFATEIAPARSFALERDVAELQRNGLARGGSLENALVLGAEGPLNPEGMRFPDEPARHKLLDAVGDLAILGGLVWARVVLVRPSHALHRALVTRAAQLVEDGAPYLFSSDPGLR